MRTRHHARPALKGELGGDVWRFGATGGGTGTTSELPVDPYPTGTLQNDATLGSADFRGAGTGNG